MRRLRISLFSCGIENEYRSFYTYLVDSTFSFHRRCFWLALTQNNCIPITHFVFVFIFSIDFNSFVCMISNYLFIFESRERIKEINSANRLWRILFSFFLCCVCFCLSMTYYSREYRIKMCDEISVADEIFFRTICVEKNITLAHITYCHLTFACIAQSGATFTSTMPSNSIRNCFLLFLLGWIRNIWGYF